MLTIVTPPIHLKPFWCERIRVGSRFASGFQKWQPFAVAGMVLDLGFFSGQDFDTFFRTRELEHHFPTNSTLRQPGVANWIALRPHSEIRNPQPKLVAAVSRLREPKTVAFSEVRGLVAQQTELGHNNPSTFSRCAFKEGISIITHASGASVRVRVGSLAEESAWSAGRGFLCQSFPRISGSTTYLGGCFQLILAP